MEAAQQRHVAYYLGNSVMNPETRVLVNKTGFCSRHFPMLREAGRAHHLGLIGHTHLQNVRGRFESHWKAVAKGSPKAVKALKDAVSTLTEECLVCESLNRDLNRYTYTAVVLYTKEEEFRTLFSNSRGPCLPHAADLAQMAVEVLSRKDRITFLEALGHQMNRTLGTLEEDVLRFTQKFDAQNDALEWGNSRDAHARTVQALSGVPVRLDD